MFAILKIITLLSIIIIQTISQDTETPMDDTTPTEMNENTSMDSETTTLEMSTESTQSSENITTSSENEKEPTIHELNFPSTTIETTMSDTTPTDTGTTLETISTVETTTVEYTTPTEVDEITSSDPETTTLETTSTIETTEEDKTPTQVDETTSLDPDSTTSEMTTDSTQSEETTATSSENETTTEKLNNETTCEDKVTKSEINGLEQDFLWTTENTTFRNEWNKGYASNPLCLLENYELQFAYCNDLKWSETRPCVNIQKPIPECPPGYYNLNSRLCYMFTNPSPWYSECPVKNLWAFNSIANLAEIIAIVSKVSLFWVPLARNSTYGFESNNLDSVKEFLYIQNNTDYKENTCFALNSSTSVSKLTLLNCNQELPTFCLIRKVNVVKTSETNLGFYDEYGKKGRVFYVQEMIPNNTNRIEYCKKLAEPLDAYSINYFNSWNTCWFGLEKDNEKFVWSSTKQEIQYTNWNVSVDFSQTYGAVDSNKKWILLSNTMMSNVDCAFCETTIERSYENLELIVRNRTRGIDIVYHNQILMEPRIICYTNSGGMVKEINTGIFEYENFNQHYIPIIEYIGEYWCKTKTINNEIVVSNTVLVHKYNGTLEYVFDVTVYNSFALEPALIVYREYTVTFGELYAAGIMSLIMANNYIDIRTVLIKSINQKLLQMNIVMHITIMHPNPFNSIEPHEQQNTTNDYGNSLSPEDELKEYNLLKTFIENLEIRPPFLRYGELKRSDTCFETTSIDETNDRTLHWNTTKIGNATLPNEICLVNGRLVYRQCEGSFVLGASWSTFTDICDPLQETSEITNGLYDVISSDKTPEEIVTATNNLTQKPQVISSTDVYLVSTILESVSTEQVDLNDTLSIVNNLMNANKTSLQTAQDRNNATDTILNALDNLLERSDPSADVKLKTPKIIAQALNLRENSMRGIALKFSENGNDFTNFEILSLPAHWSDKEISEIENLDLVILIPENVSSDNNKRLIASTFFDDSLFNDARNETEVAGRPVSILIPGVTELAQPISVWFKDLVPAERGGCAFWKYGLDSMNVPISGAWQQENDQTAKINQHNKQFHVCEFDHLTHFTLLVSEKQIEEIHNTVLTVLTAIGCALSLIGILSIFVTAAVFGTWTSDKGHKILLQVSLSILLQYLLFFVANFTTNSKTFCILMSCFLHYIVLSQFCWMMVIAYLQYRRFVIVLGKEPSNLILKSALIGWVVPILPAAIAASVAQDDADKQICYPSGLTLWLGVVLPILIIVAINVIFFTRIILNLRASNGHFIRNKEKYTKAMLKLSIFLFFITGCSWIFGIAAALDGGIVFAYLFCLTAPLQGFVLFLYFVVIHESTRHLWNKLINISAVNKCMRQSAEFSVPPTPTSSSGTKNTSLEDNKYY